MSRIYPFSVKLLVSQLRNYKLFDKKNILNPTSTNETEQSEVTHKLISDNKD